MTCQCPDHNCTAVHAPFFIQSDTQRRRLCAFCYKEAHGWQWEAWSRQREPWPDEDFEDDDTIWFDSDALIDHQTGEERWEGRG